MTTHRSVTPLLSSLGLDAALLTSHCHHHRQGEFYFFKDAKQHKTSHTNLILVRPHRQLSICCIIQDIYGHVTGAEWGQQLQWHLTHHLALLAWGGWAWAGAPTRQGGRRQSSAFSNSSYFAASKLENFSVKTYWGHHSAIFPCQCLWVCPIQNWSMVSFIQHL